MKNTGRVRSALRGGVLLLLLVLLVSAPFVTAQTAAPNWTQLSPTGGPPSARNVHSAVYEAATNRMTVFGGAFGNCFIGACLNDVWVLTNADGLGGTPTWTQLNPTGPGPSGRGTHSSVYDPAMNRMIVFGGNQSLGFCGGELNDVWVLSNANGLGGTPSWQQLSPVGGPPSPRRDHSAVYDPANNRMIVFGGAPACGSGNDEVWVLTNANGLGGAPAWTQLSPMGGPVIGGAGHSAVYDRGSNRMIVFGGCGSVTCPSADIWILSNANGLGGAPTWTKLNPTGGPPPGRSSHRAVYDPASNRMTVFGGCCPLFNDAWVLSHANGLGGTPNWTQLSPGGGPPNPRQTTSAVLNPASNRMTVFGGYDGSNHKNDVWVLTNANGIVLITVEIDILPRIFPNRLNLRFLPAIPVAVLTTPSFNAADVAVSTVRFAGAAPLVISGRGSVLVDVDGDGDRDLVLLFATRDVNLTCASTQATLTGQTTTGTQIQGTDSVRITRDKTGQVCP